MENQMETTGIIGFFHTIMENQMEKKWKIKWKLELYRGLWGLGFPKFRGTF